MYPFNEIMLKEPIFYCFLSLILLMAIIGFLKIYRSKTVANHVILKRVKDYWRQQFLAATIYTYEKERASYSILHPNLDAPLAAIHVLIGKVPLNDEESNRIVDDANGILSNTVQRIKNIALNPQPSMLDKSRLTEALQNLVDVLSGASSLTIYVATDGVSSLSYLQELAIYKKVQRLANSILKVKRANRLNIELKKINGEMLLFVKDLQTRQPIKMAVGV